MDQNSSLNFIGMPVVGGHQFIQNNPSTQGEVSFFDEVKASVFF
jgi:hypothetical protein